MAKDEGKSSLNSTTKVRKERKTVLLVFGNQGSRNSCFYLRCFIKSDSKHNNCLAKSFSLISSLLVN